MRTGNRYRLLLCSLPLVATLAYFIYSAIQAPLSDFASYYFGSRELLGGDYMNVYDTYRLNLLIAAQGQKGIFVSYTPFTPFTSIVFSPFLGMDIGTSKLAFNIFSSIVFAATAYRACRHFDLPAYLLVLVPVILWMPLKNNLLFGQAYLLLFALLSEGFMALQKKRPWITGITWGIAIVFKVFPVLLLLYLLLKKEYRAAFYTVVASAALLVISIAVNGYHTWLFYARLLPRLNEGELNDSFTYMFQSFFMLSKNIFVHDRLLNPGSYFNSLPAFVISVILFKTSIVASAITATLQKRTDGLPMFAAWIMASLLISPNGSSYSLVLLLIAVFGLFTTDIPLVIKCLVAGLVFLACNINIHAFDSLPLLMKFPRLYLLLIVFVVLIISTRPSFRYRIFLPVLLLFVLTGIPKLFHRSDRSEYLLSKEEHILVTDVFASGGRLGYRYWSEQGEQNAYTDIPVISVEDARLVNNQVVYNGRQLTEGDDWKRKPLLVNNEYIVYLSDKNRGIGFYTLRKIEIE